MNIPLGSIIHRLRCEHGLTQRVLAYHLCVSEQAISKWERGQSYPDISLLVPIADFFNVSLDSLFGREEKKT